MPDPPNSMDSSAAYSLQKIRLQLETPPRLTAVARGGPEPRPIAFGISKVNGLNNASREHGIRTPMAVEVAMQKFSVPPLTVPTRDHKTRNPLFEKLYLSQGRPRRDGPRLSTPMAISAPQLEATNMGGGTANDGGQLSRLPNCGMNAPGLLNDVVALRSSFPEMESGDESEVSVEAEGPFPQDGEGQHWGHHLLASSNKIQRNNEELKANNDKMRRAYDRVSQKSVQAKAALSVARSRLEDNASVIAELRGTILSCEARLEESLKNVQNTKQLVSERDIRVESLTLQLSEKDRELERLRDQGKKLGQCIRGLHLEIEERTVSFTELHERYRHVNSLLDESRSTIRDLRASAAEAMDMNESLGKSDGWLSKMRDSKVLIDELQSQLQSSNEVITILRDKLHHMASVVAESKARVDDLEEEKKASLARVHQELDSLKVHYERSALLGEKAEKLTDRLVTRELETFDYLASAVGLEERLEGAKAEIIRLNGILSEYKIELTSLRACKAEHLESILATQDVMNGKDKEIVALRAEIKSLNESKAELRALWSECKQALFEKDQELLRRDLNSALEAGVQKMTSQLENLLLGVADTQDKYAQYENKLVASEKSYLDSQARSFEEKTALQKKAYDALETSMNQKCSQLQEKLEDALNRVNVARTELEQARMSEDRLESEKTQMKEGHQKEYSKLQATHDELRASVSLLEQEKRGLQQNLADACERLARRRDELSQLQASFREERKEMKNQFESQLNAEAKSAKLQEKLAQSAERELKQSQDLLVVANAQVLDSGNRLSVLTSDLEHAHQVLAQKDEQLSCMRPTADHTGLQVQNETLIKENEELRQHALRIAERYHQGTLTGAEKDLIRHAVSIAVSTLEQNAVEMDRQIMTRDIQLNTLQQRIKGLEKTLVQVLGDRTGETRPILGLQSLVNSSPKDETVNEGKADADPNPSTSEGQTDVNAATITAAAIISTPTAIGEGQSTFRKLSQLDSESEEDTPLSEFSRLGSNYSDRIKMKKRVRLSSPIPVPVVQPKKRTAKNAPASKRGAKQAASAAVRKVSEEVGKGRSLKRK